MNPYLYMFVRDDLPHPVQIVQMSHAVDEIGKLHASNDSNYMVLCEASNEDYLYEVSDYLSKNGIDHHMFWEPDIQAYTAICTKPLKGDERNVMKKFKLKK
jgi:hypothetical protein